MLETVFTLFKIIYTHNHHRMSLIVSIVCPWFKRSGSLEWMYSVFFGLYFSVRNYSNYRIAFYWFYFDINTFNVLHYSENFSYRNNQKICKIIVFFQQKKLWMFSAQ